MESEKRIAFGDRINPFYLGAGTDVGAGDAWGDRRGDWSGDGDQAKSGDGLRDTST